MPATLHRRHALGLALLPLVLDAGELASASPLSLALQRRNLSPQGIELEFPALADTGNAVPLEASIRAPQGLKLVVVEVFLPENPNPLVLKLNLGQALASYRFSTRLRLAASQSVWVVAGFSDGSQRAASAPTLITSSACFDAS